MNEKKVYESAEIRIVLLGRDLLITLHTNYLPFFRASATFRHVFYKIGASDLLK